MSKIVIDFKHEDVHQPKPWPIGITDEIVTSGLGNDDGAQLIGFAKKGEQVLAYFLEDTDDIDFETQDIVPVFSANGGFFNWDIPIRGIRTIEEVITDKHLIIDIQMSNDAAQTGEELAEILRGVIAQIEQQDEGRPIFDLNGNKVGAWEYKEIAR